MEMDASDKKVAVTDTNVDTTNRKLGASDTKVGPSATVRPLLCISNISSYLG
jgi:hypothetical protein